MTVKKTIRNLAIGPAVAGLILTLGLWPVNAQAPGLPTLEKLVGEWSRLRTAIADEERAWNRQEKQWRDEIALLEKEKATLDKNIQDAQKAARDAEAERVEDLRDKEKFERMFEGLLPLLDRAEAELAKWPARLPPALRESLTAAFKRLPADEKQREALSDGARLQTVVALYAELDKLQHAWHPVKEVLPLPDGSRKEMDVLYLGLARAFAVSPDNDYAAVGVPGPEGWTWDARPRLAPAVRRAVEVVLREHPAELVVLPLQVKDALE
jgi:hypothetical protein